MEELSNAVFVPVIGDQDSMDATKCNTLESITSLGVAQHQATTVGEISQESVSDEIPNPEPNQVACKSPLMCELSDLQTPASDSRSDTPTQSSDLADAGDPSLDGVPIKQNTSDCIVVENGVEVPNEVEKILSNDPLQSDASVFSMIQVVESVDDESSQASVSTSDSEGDSSDSDSSSTTSDDTSSDDDSCDLTIRHRSIELEEEIATLKNSEPPKIKGEILLNELPPVDDLNILLPESTLLEVVGKVAHIMPDHSVIIQSHLNKPALDFATVLFFSRESAIGKVEETFGPVPSPFYVIRFNSEEHLLAKGVDLNKEVYYAPHIQDFTSFVFVSALRSIQGSDASWCNDQEPPPSCLDYSDDEQEREARRRKKNDVTPESENKHKKPVHRNGQESSHRGNHRPRGRGRDRWHNQSTRFNVNNLPDPSQVGWQSAVSALPRQGTERLHPRIPPPPPDLFNCFQRPPQGHPEYHGPSQLYGPPVPPEGRPPPYNWTSSHFNPYTPSSIFEFPPPPPPPPP